MDATASPRRWHWSVGRVGGTLIFSSVFIALVGETIARFRMPAMIDSSPAPTPDELGRALQSSTNVLIVAAVVQVAGLGLVLYALAQHVRRRRADREVRTGP